MENLVSYAVVLIIVFVWVVMLTKIIKRRKSIISNEVRTNNREDIRSNSYVRKEEVNLSNNISSNSIHRHHTNHRDNDDYENENYHRPIDAGTGFVTGLIVNELIEDNLKITDVLDDSDKYHHERVIQEVPLSETVHKQEENTFDYNSNSFSSEPIIEQKKVVEESYEEPSYKSSYNSSSYKDEEESSSKSSYSSSSSYDSGSSYSSSDSGSSSSWGD